MGRCIDPPPPPSRTTSRTTISRVSALPLPCRDRLCPRLRSPFFADGNADGVLDFAGGDSLMATSLPGSDTKCCYDLAFSRVFVCRNKERTGDSILCSVQQLLLFCFSLLFILVSDRSPLASTGSCHPTIYSCARSILQLRHAQTASLLQNS